MKDLLKTTNIKNNYFFYLLFLFIFLVFTSIFVLSYIKIVNFWSFSQSHMNYSEGFIKRGLFGTLMFFFEEKLNVSTRIYFSTFFMFFYSLNIILFFNLIKKYLSNKLLFTFLALCPTLILFPFNDLGGYQRLDVLSITSILIHASISQLFYEKKIDEKRYQKILFYTIFPFIFFSILFHEIQLFSLPFHFFVTWKIVKKGFFNTIKKYSVFLIPSFLVFFIYPDPESIINLSKKIDGDIWSDAYLFHTKNIGLDHYFYEISTNLLITYNLKIHLMMIVLAIVPFFLMLYFFEKKYLLKNNEKNFKFLIFLTIPYLAGLAIGDFGRWVNIMSFAAFGYVSQFPLKERLKNYNLFNRDIYKFIINFALLSVVIFYLFFVRIPHCCNLQKLNITLYGGIIDKSVAILNVFFNTNRSEHFNINSRFQ